VADFAIPEPAPVPMTTIAWLYWHIGSMPGRLCDIDFLGGTRTMASGWTSPYLTHHPIFTSAAEAVTALRDGWQRLREAIERADDDQLEVTTAGYTYAAGVLPLVVGPPGPAHTATHFIAATLRLGWTFRDRDAIVTPYSEPAPDPDLLHKQMTERVAVAQSSYVRPWQVPSASLLTAIAT
jgi:DinB superfamily